MNAFNKLGPPAAVISIFLGCGSSSISGEIQSQSSAASSLSASRTDLDSPSSGIWENGTGRGFFPTVQTFSLEAGVAPGVAAFGSKQAHDLALLSLAYGHMLGDVKGEGHWYRGNFEGRLELFGGGQYSPSSQWIIGLTPHLRYNFSTGTRWIPFFDAGAGVTATGIGKPDLSGTFEFNLQAATGVRWILCDEMALTAEVRYLHMSCAGIHHPNLGANNVPFMIGVTWFFD